MMNRSEMLEYYGSERRRTLLLPVISHISQLVTKVRATTGNERLPGIYLHGPVATGSGYTEIDGKIRWVKCYVEIAPDLREVIEGVCCNGEIGSFEFIPWGEQFRGWGLLVAKDAAMIANPFITMLEVDETNEWIRHRVAKEVR